MGSSSETVIVVTSEDRESCNGPHSKNADTPKNVGTQKVETEEATAETSQDILAKTPVCMNQLPKGNKWLTFSPKVPTGSKKCKDDLVPVRTILSVVSL